MQPGTMMEDIVSDALAAIVKSSNDAIYSKDSEAIVTSWNASAQRLYGWKPEEIIGRPISTLIPETKRGEELDILATIMEGGHVDHFLTERVRKDGGIVKVSISVSPVHNRDGEVVEAAVIARDVTQQKALENALLEERRSRVQADRKQALELNDELVQGLVVAKLALESGNHEQGLRTISSTLERAKSIVSRLLIQHKEERPLVPGDLIRDELVDPLAVDEEDR